MYDQRAIALLDANDLHIIPTSGFFAEENSHHNLLLKVYERRWRRIRLNRVLFPHGIPLGLVASNSLQRLTHATAVTFCNGLKWKLDRRLVKFCCGYLREQARPRDFFRWRADKEQDEQRPNNEAPQNRVE